MENSQLLKIPELLDRYGISRSTLHRWLYNEALNFPKPARIAGRPYWRLTDLEAFEEKATEANV